MPKSSRAAAALIAFLAIGAAAACAEPDLQKAAFQRTTIPATATSSGSSVTDGNGQPTDPAFSVDKLRALDPCQLLDQSVLRSYGSQSTDPLVGMDDCFSVLRDAKGTSLSVSVTIGESVLSDMDATTRQLAGLPLVERKLSQGDACFETVLTNTEPDLGITVQTNYSGGDPCRPARALLERVVQRVRADPPVRQDTAGSFASLDPCRLVAENDATGLLGATPEISAYGLWTCSWRADGRELNLQLDRGLDPSGTLTGQKAVPVRVAGVTTYQERTDYGVPACELAWAHRPVDDEFEIVRATFTDALDGSGDACRVARKLAAKVIPQLPTA